MGMRVGESWEDDSTVCDAVVPIQDSPTAPVPFSRYADITDGMTLEDLLLAARALEHDGDFASATRLLEAALSAKPDPAMLNHLAVLHARQEEFKRATELMLRAAQLDPSNPVYQANLKKIWDAALRARRR